MEAGIEIGGERYEVPTLDTLDMDEAQILFDVSGIVIEDFAPAHPDSADEEKLQVQSEQLRRVRNPAFKRALVHVAYRRKHPELDYFQISEVVGKVNAVDVTLEVLRGDDEEDPSQSSPKQSDEKNDMNGTSEPLSSGSPSGSDSAGQVVSLARTGLGRSAMSSPQSGRETQASAS